MGRTTLLKDEDITNHGRRVSQADGMFMESKGHIYYGRLTRNALTFWKASAGTVTPLNEIQLIQDYENFEWIDTFGFDKRGYLFFTSNKLELLPGDEYDSSIFNFRVMSFYTAAKSYQYSDMDPLE